MPYHHTKSKGDLAVAKIITDLVEKGYDIFTPHITEHCRFDLIVSKEGKFFRLQCKYNTDGTLVPKSSWTDKNGTHEKAYTKDDFDYYALYIPGIDKVVYPSISFAGSNIRTTMPNSSTPFYWWEDFINLTDSATKKTYKDFGITIVRNKGILKGVHNLKLRKVERPSKEELEKLLWEKPTTQIAKDFGVSDKAIQKWAEAYGISKPKRGYWNKLAQ
ncbi:MAG: hypothetical protein LC122_13660 [Chitinophagales bacterium]|nr:hypothetical protein [Chitinophagales bacterium]